MRKSAREEQLIINYLLGQATEEERARIEDNYFRNPEYHERMLALEEELIRDYLRDALSAEERGHFETHFLASDRRWRKYELTRDLIEYFSEAYAPTIATDRASWLGRLFRDSSGLVNDRMAWGMAAVILFTLCISTLIIGLQSIYHRTENQQAENQQAENQQAGNQRIDQQQAQRTKEVHPSEQQLAEQLPVRQEARSGLASKTSAAIPDDPVSTRSSKPSTGAGPKRIGPAFIPAFVVNLPGVRGDDALTEVLIPSNVARIELHLPLNEAEPLSHEAIIKTLDGDVVWRKTNLKPRRKQSERMIVLSIPTKLLEERDYVLDLCCVKEGGETRMISESFFSVKRQE